MRRCVLISNTPTLAVVGGTYLPESGQLTSKVVVLHRPEWFGEDIGGYIPAHTISIRETAGKGSYFTSTERRSLLDVARDGAKQLEQRSEFHLLGDIGATEQLMGRRHWAPGRPSCEQVVSNTSGASKGRGAGRWAA